MPMRILVYVLPALLVVSCASPPAQPDPVLATPVQYCEPQPVPSPPSDCLQQSQSQLQTESDMQVYIVMRTLLDIVFQLILNSPNRYQHAAPMPGKK